MDVAQLQQAYAELDQRVQALENLPVTLESLQSDYAALTLRVDALNNPSAKLLIGAENFRLIRGWRVPQLSLAGKTTRYASGGFAIRYIGDELRFYVHHSSPTRMVYEMTPPPGDGWPELVPGQSWSTFDDEANGYFKSGPRGLMWDEDSQRLLISGRAWYRSTETEQWFAKLDVSNGVTELVSPSVSCQIYGAGFCRIPREWADAHAGGNTIGFACGGYDTLASSSGPSLAASSPDGQAIELLKFPIKGIKDQVELRDPHYIAHHPTDNNTIDGTLSWSWPPEGDVGYWQAEELNGGPAWIDHPDFKGIVYAVATGRGTLDYRAQTSLFLVEDPATFYNPDSPSNRGANLDVQYAGDEPGYMAPVMYVYDPDDLARIAAGELNPWDVKGKRFEFPTAGIAGRPCGMIFDPKTNHVFVMYTYSWSSVAGGKPLLPVIAEYELVN